MLLEIVGNVMILSLGLSLFNELVKSVHVVLVVKFAFIKWMALTYLYIVGIYITKLLPNIVSQICYQVC